MFHAKANELRRVGNGAIASCRIAHGQNTKLSRHPIEIPHPLGDRVIREYAAERRGDGDSRRWLIGHRCRIRVQQNLRNGRKLPEQAQEGDQLDRGSLSDRAFEQLRFDLACAGEETAVLPCGKPGQHT